MGGYQRARAFALSLPGASEEPHFDMSSFRVNGKIFATVPPGEEYLHVFVDETEAEASVAEDPAAFAPLLWGKRPRGLRINLAAADDARLAELIEESWRRKAPKRLLAERDRERAPGSLSPPAEQSRAEQSGAEQSRAEQSRAEQSRAEQSRGAD